jgi:hypothetical protein
MPGRHIYGLFSIPVASGLLSIYNFEARPDKQKTTKHMCGEWGEGGGEYRQSRKSAKLREKLCTLYACWGQFLKFKLLFLQPAGNHQNDDGRRHPAVNNFEQCIRSLMPIAGKYDTPSLDPGSVFIKNV